MKKTIKRLWSLLLAACMVFSVFPAGTAFAAEVENYLILADSYDSLGTWEVVTGEEDAWVTVGRLRGQKDKDASDTKPAVATIDVKTAGTYYLWVNDKQFNTNDYTTRYFNISVNGTQLSKTFGQVKPSATGFYWEGPYEVTLTAGTNTIQALDTSAWYANLNGILLTPDAALDPSSMTYAEIEEVSTKKSVEIQVDLMEDVTISTDFPGGSVIVKSKQEGVVTFEPDMTGHDYSSGTWFYWNFKVTSTTDRTVTFKTNARYLGDGGPLYSTDEKNLDIFDPQE